MGPRIIIFVMIQSRDTVWFDGFMWIPSKKISVPVNLCLRCEISYSDDWFLDWKVQTEDFCDLMKFQMDYSQVHEDPHSTLYRNSIRPNEAQRDVVVKVLYCSVPSSSRNARFQVWNLMVLHAYQLNLKAKETGL